MCRRLWGHSFRKLSRAYLGSTRRICYILQKYCWIYCASSSPSYLNSSTSSTFVVFQASRTSSKSSNEAFAVQCTLDINRQIKSLGSKRVFYGFKAFCKNPATLHRFLNHYLCWPPSQALHNHASRSLFLFACICVLLSSSATGIYPTPHLQCLVATWWHDSPHRTSCF